MSTHTKYLPGFAEATVNSYAQVFFSKNRIFAFILLIVSFFDVWAGISGLLAVLFTVVGGLLMGLDHRKIVSGLYGFNSLLVGLGLGIYYQPGLAFYTVLFLASIFTLFLSVVMEGVIGKYYLPFLSVPFIFSIWIVLLATRHFENLGISERGVYTLNEVYRLGGPSLVSLYEKIKALALPGSVRLYFLSLAAILFQSNVLAGILISIGLLLYSRIAFSLSLLGFYTAYLFYLLLGINLAEVSYGYIGFNYILTAIAIGGFFLIPSVWTYLWVILLTPLVTILTISLDSVFSVFHLPVYALPFNIMVLIFLYVLKFRTTGKKRLKQVSLQQFSPEKNLYGYQNSITRFNYDYPFPFRLPFWGTWVVSQGHDGEYTHKEEWKYAWDFMIKDESDSLYKNDGDQLTDYYCYGKKVVAAGDGIIEEITDGIDDNAAGDINIQQNWGNTVVIRHAEFLYSQMSHLMKGSMTVKKGQSVKAGDIIGKTGNSGRSPYPHLHFQFQATPSIGSTTIYYPFVQYLKYEDQQPLLQQYAIPREHDHISKLRTMPLLVKAFHLIPGRTLEFEPQGTTFLRGFIWDVQTDSYNNPFLYCRETGSKAFFYANQTQFYFTWFEGDKKSFLYFFFLSLFRVQLGFYKGLNVTDQYPLHLVFNPAQLVLQDFLAPFVIIYRADYHLKYASIDNPVMTSEIVVDSTSSARMGKKQIKKIHFRVKITNRGVDHFTMRLNGEKTEIACKG